ncbi:MGMT family protein [Pararcticibacter amylolyticus]|uniref:Cysteine methyltransferase n=1 Tax=Pararcticibacter amylolyticus TaxID=2173175 RepID=A0A2U2PMJ0_9SPHI|nr:MGMT family protein [Pararcticibacter amylolyticus]PWG82524.1 cysteine methyltransferase [Pararcticibacter amylolyticus]
MDKENFFERVYDIVRQIPYGRVTSYGAIAEYLGTKGSSRMVGYAMNACGTAYPPVPAHRVVNHQGLLTGKRAFASPNLMQELLQSEGIEIKNDKVMDFKHVFWHPADLQTMS